MLDKLKRTVELVNQLVASKQNLADKLVEKGEEVSLNTPFDELTQKAGDYVPKTYVLVDQNGREVVATYVDEETIFDATENDVREGKVFANETGVVTGTKVIPVYNVSEGYAICPVGSKMSIPLPILDKYDFTRLQIVVCRFNTSLSNSVYSDTIVLNDSVYRVESTDKLSTVVKNSETKSIDLGLVNSDTVPLILRYFTYKEIY